MLIAYDPVAKELILEVAPDQPPLSLHLPALMVKLYGDDGIVMIEMKGEQIDIAFYPAEALADAVIDAIAPHRWRLQTRPGCAGEA